MQDLDLVAGDLRIGVGSLVLSVLAERLLELLGWRRTFWVLGGVIALVVAPLTLLFQREAPVARQVISVRVRLDRANDPDAAPLRLLEVLLDREGRVDDDGGFRIRVADEV